MSIVFEPGEGLSVTDHEITTRYGDTVTVVLKTSQAGISYQLVKDSQGHERLLLDPEKGNKEAKIDLQSNVRLVEDTKIKVKAFRTLDPNIAAYLETPLFVKVRPNPKVAVSAEPSIIDYRTPTRLTLTAAQSSTKI